MGLTKIDFFYEMCKLIILTKIKLDHWIEGFKNLMPRHLTNKQTTPNKSQESGQTSQNTAKN